ncbi:hypothetical protein KC669_03400, partial [Candidatus Dojkabacteria bacterium]|nr:hypothetical protein [Candidatus Dojkabacteria bacterium]
MNQNRYRFLTILNIVLFLALVLGTLVLVDQDNNKDLPVTDITESYGCGRLDIYNDNKVELDDFAAFVKFYSKECNLLPAPDFYPTCGFKDANENGNIDLFDFAWFASLYYKDKCELYNN